MLPQPDRPLTLLLLLPACSRKHCCFPSLVSTVCFLRPPPFLYVHVLAGQTLSIISFFLTITRRLTYYAPACLGFSFIGLEPRPSCQLTGIGAQSVL